jgi:hypothetical protein
MDCSFVLEGHVRRLEDTVKVGEVRVSAFIGVPGHANCNTALVAIRFDFAGRDADFELLSFIPVLGAVIIPELIESPDLRLVNGLNSRKGSSIVFSETVRMREALIIMDA